MTITSATEQALTLVGVGIPASLPVYRACYQRFVGRWRDDSQYNGDSNLAQFTIGGHQIRSTKSKGTTDQRRRPSLPVILDDIIVVEDEEADPHGRAGSQNDFLSSEGRGDTGAGPRRDSGATWWVEDK